MDDAEINYIWVPLDRDIEFDEQKSNQFLDEYLGTDYGYQLLLIGLLDTVKDNFRNLRNKVRENHLEL
jgi:hypothetical protein